MTRKAGILHRTSRRACSAAFMIRSGRKTTWMCTTGRTVRCSSPVRRVRRSWRLQACRNICWMNVMPRTHMSPAMSQVWRFVRRNLQTGSRIPSAVQLRTTACTVHCVCPRWRTPMRPGCSTSTPPVPETCVPTDPKEGFQWF